MAVISFATAPVLVPLQTLVVWVNQDTVVHTITSVTGEWDSGPIQPGQSFSFRFTRTGSFPFFCSLHGAEKEAGTVEVTTTPPSGVPSAGPSVGPSVPSPTVPGTQPSLTPLPPPTPFPSPTISVPGTENRVEIVIAPGASTRGSLAFGANPRNVPIGSVVMWINNDTVEHSVVSDTQLWDSGALQSGGRFSWPFPVAGTYRYHCGIHGSDEAGTIEVRAP